MLTSDEISALISEFRSGHIRSDEKLINFLAIKQLTFDDAIKLLNGLLENNFQEYIGIIYSWLRQNLKILIEKYSPQFTLIMETISKKESEYITGLLLSLQELDLDADSLMNVYRITSNSQNQDLKISSGFILGEIGIVQPKVLIEEFHTIFNQPDELNELAFFKAVLVSSDRYRRTNFILTNDIKSAIIKCTKSSNIRLASEAIKLCVVSFDRDPRFKTALQEYFNQSSEHRSEIYQYIEYNDLGDVEFELALLYASLNSNIHDEIRLAQRVIETKILRSSRPLNNNSNIDVLQKFALDYIQELFNRKDLLDEGLLAQIGNANIVFAFDYLLKWIGNGKVDIQANLFFYSKLIYHIFKNHENEFFEFLQKLVGKDDNKFDILVCRTINEMVVEAKGKFRSELKIHNNATVRKLRKFIKDENKHSELKPIESNDLNKLPDILARYTEILNEQQVSDTSTDYNAIVHMINDLKTRRQLFIRKCELLDDVLSLLISISKKYNINYKIITEDFQGHKIDSVVMRCQILASELLTMNSQEKINYEDIEKKLSSFQNIEKFLGFKWLKEKCLEGHPYHLILLWLSRLIDRNQMEQLVTDCESEKDKTLKYIKIEKLERALRPLVWLRYVDTCIGYFTKENDKGKKAIISHLKDRQHFLQTLAVGNRNEIKTIWL